jgi:hypothetical protein
MAIGARFEKRWFEAGASLSLTEDKWFGVGTYVRLGLLTIGSDHINALIFGQPKFRGADVYMSLKIMPFGSGEKEEGGMFIPFLSRTKLAQRTGFGREYVSRMITKLKDEGHIELRGRGVLLKTLGA